MKSELTTVQSNVDSYSSRVSELEKGLTEIRDNLNTVGDLDQLKSKIFKIEQEVRSLKEGYQSMDGVEGKIMKAAENKFEILKGAIKNDMGREVVSKIWDGQATIKRDADYKLMKVSGTRK